jgi:hypothetical protein
MGPVATPALAGGKHHGSPRNPRQVGASRWGGHARNDLICGKRYPKVVTLGLQGYCEKRLMQKRSATSRPWANRKSAAPSEYLERNRPKSV